MAINPAEAIEEERQPIGGSAESGHALSTGTRLRDYEITGLIGEGGFGIVYLAWDHSLQRKVAIKEYMPASMVSRIAGSSAIVVKSDRHLDTFKAGLKSFVNEARLLARFDHPSLVKVYRFWEENGTAYMVMPFYEGPTLKTALAELGHVPSEAELRAWLKPVLNAVSVLHDGETWHQNIGPDAIMLTPVGPVLLGFASAEHTVASLLHTPAVALKPGFAAIEQYGGVAQTTRGPWTDLYALAAVVYAAITGDDPAPAADRLADDRLAPLSNIAAGLYSERFLSAIDAALVVQPERRPRDHLQFRALMGDIETPERLELAPPLDLMQEPFAGAVEGNRQVTVPDGPAPAAAASGPGVATLANVAKSKTAARAAASELSTPRSNERAAPSWMRVGRGGAAFGKRAAYGLVAGTCVLIGIAALALDYYGRHAQRAPSAATPPSAAAPSMAVIAPVDPAASSAPAVAVKAAVANPIVAPTAVPPVPVASVGHSAAPAAVVVTPTIPVAPAPSPSPPPAASAAAVAAVAAAPAPLRPAVATTATIEPPAPATAAERQTRCLEILQKASLEPISPADTAFFKRECK